MSSESKLQIIETRLADRRATRCASKTINKSAYCGSGWSFACDMWITSMPKAADYRGLCVIFMTEYKLIQWKSKLKETSTSDESNAY